MRRLAAAEVNGRISLDKDLSNDTADCLAGIKRKVGIAWSCAEAEINTAQTAAAETMSRPE